MRQSRALTEKPTLAKRLINIEWLSVTKAERSRKTIIVPNNILRRSIILENISNLVN